jgi:hypothetical protein
MHTMNAVPFDKLKLAHGLEAAGLAAPVAAGTAAALAEAMGGADLATKADIGAVKTEITMLESRVIAAIGNLETKVMGAVGALDTKFDNKFAAFETKYDSKLELLRRDMTIKLGGMIFIATGVILAALRIMPHP